MDVSRRDWSACYHPLLSEDKEGRVVLADCLSQGSQRVLQSPRQFRHGQALRMGTTASASHREVSRPALNGPGLSGLGPDNGRNRPGPFRVHNMRPKPRRCRQSPCLEAERMPMVRTNLPARRPDNVVRRHHASMLVIVSGCRGDSLSLWIGHSWPYGRGRRGGAV